MKPFFAKYLPVEGDLENEDQDRFGVQFEEGGEFQGAYLITEFPVPLLNDITAISKVKLFIFDRESNRVLGEVSSNATWIKEEDEFEYGEISSEITRIDDPTLPIMILNPIDSKFY